MRVLPSSPQAIDEALTILAQGGVVAHVTETCYGLACDLTNPKAVARLFAIKKRPEDRPVSALFPSVEEAKKYVVWNDEAEKLAQKFLPGPLTLILPRNNDASRLFVSPTTNYQLPTTNSIGIRVSSHPLALTMARRFGKPLSTTSANVHGQPNPYSAKDIEGQFASATMQPDLILDSGELPHNPPSTVIDLTEKTKILRKGTL